MGQNGVATTKLTTKTDISHNWCNKRGGAYQEYRRRRTYDNRRRYYYRRTPADGQALPTVDVPHDGQAERRMSQRQKDNLATQRRDADDRRCTYQQKLTQVCQQLDQASGWRNIKGHLGGCTWSSGFNYYQYSDFQIQNLAMLRSAADPYIAALSITGGSLNFGNTQAQNATIGIIFLVIGCICLIPCYILMFL